MQKHKEFCFVDFAAKYQHGFRNNIVHVSEIPELIKKFRAYECYSTSFLFTVELKEYVRENGSVSGYDGYTFATYLVLDIDAIELEKALGSARRILFLLTTDWELPGEAIQCYFSGRKGFHLLIDSRVFGDIQPSKNLHYIFSKVREIIAKDAGVDMDLTIKDKLRLLRLPNTVNAKSGLYKIPFSVNELFSLDVEKIIEKAGIQGRLIDVNRSGLLPEEEVSENKYALEVFKKALFMARERRIKVTIDTSLSGEKPEDVLCEARKHIWYSSIEEGIRHNCAMRVLSQFHVSGFEKEKSLNLMTWWNKTNRIGLPEREIFSMVESVYSSSHPYSYGCRDSILQMFCPYRKKLAECGYYRRFRKMRRRPILSNFSDKSINSHIIRASTQEFDI